MTARRRTSGPLFPLHGQELLRQLFDGDGGRRTRRRRMASYSWTDSRSGWELAMGEAGAAGDEARDRHIVCAAMGGLRRRHRGDRSRSRGTKGIASRAGPALRSAAFASEQADQVVQLTAPHLGYQLCRRFGATRNAQQHRDEAVSRGAGNRAVRPPNSGAGVLVRSGQIASDALRVD